MYRLCVVDDEPKIRWRVQHMVRSFDLPWESVAAAGGLQALDLLGSLQADLVLTDIRMPAMDGLAFVEALRARGCASLVVMLSAHTDFAYTRHALRLGVLDYLAKPLDPTELRAVLLRAEQLLALAANRLVTREDGETREVLRRQLLAELLEGRLPAQDWLPRAEPLDLLGLAARVTTLSYPEAAHEPMVGWVRQVTEQLGPPLIQWDRARLSLIALSSPADSPATSGVSALDVHLLQALARCPVAGVRIGSGDLHPIEQARTSYLESVRRLQEPRDPETPPADARPLPPGPGVSASAQRAVQQACARIGEQYADPLTLESIAGAVHFHPKYLCALFPLVTGYSFGDYLANTRLDRARELLAGTTLPCYAIATRVGYRTERCFAQAFRRRVGLTPTEYRQAHAVVPGASAERLTLSDRI